MQLAMSCLQSKEKSGPNTQNQAKGKNHKHTLTQRALKLSHMVIFWNYKFLHSYFKGFLNYSTSENTKKIWRNLDFFKMLFSDFLIVIQ